MASSYPADCRPTDDLIGLTLDFEKLILSKEDAASKKWSDIGKSNVEYVISHHETNTKSSTTQENTARTTSKSELRGYQKELAEYALTGKNTLICAPTGSGKTKVAIHIINEHLKNHEGGTRKVAFLARTVPLLMQQHKMLCQELPEEYKITSICGRNKSSIKLHLLVPEYDVIVMTPMILYNSLKEKFLEHLGVFSLIVFDECHHTHKGEPYNLLMLNYLETKSRNDESIRLPQIVGLTASVGVEKAQKVEDAVKPIFDLCGNLDVENISIVEKFKDELESYLPNLNEKSKQLREQYQTEIAQKITGVMIKMENELKKLAKEISNDELKNLVSKIPDTKRKCLEYRQWAESVKREARSEIIDSSTHLCVRTIIIIVNYLIVYNCALDTLDLVELKDVMQHLKTNIDYTVKVDEYTLNQEKTFYNYFQELDEFVSRKTVEENRNLITLNDILKENLKEESQKGIIFVKTRLLTEALASWLNRNEWAASPFTSANNTLGLGMSQQQQESILEAFRNGEKRILVATSVAEEGLDIPECNLVVKYNHVGNEITTVQTRGRARAKDGVSVLLAMDEILKKEIQNRHKMTLMHDALKSLRNWSPSEWTSKMKIYQASTLKDAKEKEKTENERKRKLVHTDFTMVCHLCRKFQVHSSKIKLINKTCLAALDSSLLSQVWMFASAKGIEEFDEIEYVADARCLCEPQPGKKCRAFLGRIVRCCNNPVLALKVKNFEFKTKPNARPQKFNQLKKVPFFVDDITHEDIQRYIFEDSSMDINEEVHANETHGNVPRNSSSKRDHSLEARETDKRQKLEPNTQEENSLEDVFNNIDAILENE
ncbi:ATP-dependent RNA helicase DDX58 [Biomphalaria glabrata]|nr:putative ATP-dependent RNA helicase DDX58 [Biomphalaria glabrata]